MASKTVHDAVAARLGPIWNGLKVIGPNQGGRPSDRSPFLAWQVPVANRRQISFGSPGANLFREEGALRFVPHVGVGEGVDQALAWADMLSALFLNASFGGVQTWTPTPPAFDDRNEDGGYYRVSISVPYTLDTLA